MKTFVIAGCLLAALSALAKETSWRVVESREVAWRSNETYRIELQVPNSWDKPGDFIRMVIWTAAGKKFVFEDQDGLVAWDDQIDDPYLKTRNLLQSRYLYLSPDILTGKSSPALLLVGHPYASSPGTLHVITLDAKGNPHEAFASLLRVSAIVPSTADHGPWLVGQRCFAEVDWFPTYAPYSVFVIDGSGAAPATLSEAESKAYNLAHYAGWRGTECSAAYRVVPAPSGTAARIVTADEARSIADSWTDELDLSDDEIARIHEKCELPYPPPAGATIDRSVVGCKSRGGIIRRTRFGFNPCPVCIHPYPDGGKSCSDSSECKGMCLASGPPADSSAKVVGTCQKDDDSTGCLYEIIKGHTGAGVCTD